ncbi:DNA repair protein [Obba rivulosa]|uniref:DNA repair protein REV1 n=1 Tax=Obba rivulosa TaxID=1052685 RepID=A0A8E2DG06_9APHY|nr:DNA repair protein [Obba rivulosa]
MARKRAKLQIQNSELDRGEGQAGRSQIFRGLQIYINGWTEPSVQDLRQLIIQHGGIYHAYLDKKGLVTHIITCSLTPAKIREFKHMKVVRPEWLVESVKAEALLPWHDYVFRPTERLEASQGKQVAQRSLFETFVSQSKKPQDGPSSPSYSTSIAELEASAVSTAGPSHRLAQASGTATPPRSPTKVAQVPDPVTPPRSPMKPAPSTSSEPLYTTDPSTPEQAARVPGYAAHASNPIAQRAMADPAWRAAHTSVAPDFIEGYYKNSRLHHLSTWKAELKNMVMEAQEQAENGGASVLARLGEGDGSVVGKIVQENMDGTGFRTSSSDDVSMRGARLEMKQPGKGKGKERALEDDQERVIMHCDFDSFFVSAGLLDRPHLRGKPVVVCHSQGAQGGASSTSEIASASYEAREFGIKSGMSLQQARKLCPTVLTMPYEFHRYKQLSLQFYTILMAHADDLQAVSVDEALIDVTSSVGRIKSEIAQSQDPSSSPADPAKEFAEAIRAQVRKVTGCEVSIGIAHNILLARLASRKAKPAGSFHIFPADVPEFLAPLDIDNLHGFGYSAHQKAQEKLGATNLGELAKKSKAQLCDALGKGTGETLYKAIRGIDERKLESDKPRKSVSCDVNYGIRFENNEQVEIFMYQLAEEVARRLDAIDMRGRSLTLKILKRHPEAPVEAPKFMGHGLCETFTKQSTLIAPGGRATSDPKLIGELSWRLLKSFNFDPKELRGIGVQIQKLEKTSATAATEPGQAILPFKAVESPKRGADSASADHPQAVETSLDKPLVVVEPPSQEDDAQTVEKPAPKPAAAPDLDLPSFSQVDMSVFEALPADVRKELEDEYNRRSITPGLSDTAARSRSPSVQPLPAGRKHRLLVKGTNLKRITQQLAPRNRPKTLTNKGNLFVRGKQAGPSSLHISENELRKLDIDPVVFAELPVELQREALAQARSAKAPGAVVYSQHKVLKPKPKKKQTGIRRAPPPKARFADPPSLKQQGKTKGTKLYFTEKEDVQRVIEDWVNGFREYPPNQGDIDFFAKFLVRCVDSARSSDTGVERAVAVTKWWLILLRRHFGVWEHAPEPGSEDSSAGAVTSEAVGRAWWKAFREVKGKMDEVARRRFGGCLSLR